MYFSKRILFPREMSTLCTESPASSSVRSHFSIFPDATPARSGVVVMYFIAMIPFVSVDCYISIVHYFREKINPLRRKKFINLLDKRNNI